jgi:PIN domain nuclease of toxin-antitoxin system
MASVVADTHALVWYLSRPHELSAAASNALVGAAAAGDLIYVSAISLVELIYLVERGRIERAVLEAIRC